MLEPVGAGPSPTEAPLVTNHRHILTSAAMLGSATILVKLAAFAKEWLIARRFGVSDELDAFLVAFLIPSFAVAVAAGSFASAFMPTYIRVLDQQGPAAARKLAGSVLVCGLIVLTAITLILAVTAHTLLPWVSMGFDESKLALTESLFHVVLGILLVSGLSAVFSAVLNAHGHFAITAAAPMTIPVATVIVFWFFQERYGIYALAAGTMLGFLLESCVLAAGMRFHGLLPRPGWSGSHANLSHVGTQYLHVTIGSLLMSSSIVVDQSMAASLGSGNVSILSYSNKIVNLVLSMVAVSLSTVLFPQFSRMITAGQWVELKRTVRAYTKIILLASIPGVALLALLSEPLVHLLFERGAFTPATTRAVSHVQIYYTLQIPFYVLSMLGARLLSALDGNAIVLRIGALNLALNIAGNYVFMHWFGVAGIAISTSVMYLVACVVMSQAIRMKMSEVAAMQPASGSA